MRNQKRSAAPWILAALLAPTALAQSAGLSVDGTVQLHGGGASLDGSIDPQSGADGGELVDRQLPVFIYDPPTADTTYGTPIPSGAVTITGAAGGETKLQYTATTLGATDVLTVSGGGTVMIHVTGNLTLDHTTVVITDGTRVVFFVDGATSFDYTTITQTGGGTLQIQGRGDVNINTLAFSGVAFANDTLRLDTDGEDMTGLIVMNEGLLRANQEAVQQLRVLPIVEGQ